MSCVVDMHSIIKNLIRGSSKFQFGSFHFHLSSKLCCTMNGTDLFDPPQNLNGMKVLNRDAFQKNVPVPCVEINDKLLKVVMKPLKKYLLKIVKLKAIQRVNAEKQRILLNPTVIKNENDFYECLQMNIKKSDISEINFYETFINLKYENWSAASLLKAVLPKEEPPLTSYSIIGHIVHINLKEHLLEYKHIIAEILLDKIPSIKTVVYKKNIIDNVYRNFDMEILQGEPNFFVNVKENGCTFEFDFSKVYWNPRLSTEHSKIVEMLKHRDVLFDVFAGVGPFAIPAAKKQCIVLANDLNPESYKWLNHNIKLNKKSQNNITTFNKDGGDFILNDAKTNLLKLWRDEYFCGKIYFVMNLPAVALSFINKFKGLLNKDDLLSLQKPNVEKFLPLIHCYFFAKYSENEKELFEKHTGILLNDVKHSFHYIRKVSTSKSMYRVSFEMPLNYLLAAENLENNFENYEPLAKKFCTH